MMLVLHDWELYRAAQRETIMCGRVRLSSDYSEISVAKIKDERTDKSVNRFLAGKRRLKRREHQSGSAKVPCLRMSNKVLHHDLFNLLIGHYNLSSGHEQGFVYSNGAYTLLQFPGAVNTHPISINDKGQVTGYYQTSGAIDPQHAFVYSNGLYTSIDPPAGVDPLAFSINNSGQVIGYYSDNVTNHGFLATLLKK
jgi:probable HAF family extracellular repeat protein